MGKGHRAVLWEYVLVWFLKNGHYRCVGGRVVTVSRDLSDSCDWTNYTYPWCWKFVKLERCMELRYAYCHIDKCMLSWRRQGTCCSWAEAWRDYSCVYVGVSIISRVGDGSDEVWLGDLWQRKQEVLTIWTSSVSAELERGAEKAS